MIASPSTVIWSSPTFGDHAVSASGSDDAGAADRDRGQRQLDRGELLGGRAACAAAARAIRSSAKNGAHMNRSSGAPLTLSLQLSASWRHGVLTPCAARLVERRHELQLASPVQNASHATITCSICSRLGPPLAGSRSNRAAASSRRTAWQPSMTICGRASSGAPAALSSACVALRPVDRRRRYAPSRRAVHRCGVCFGLLLAADQRASTTGRSSARMASAAIDFEPVLLDQAMDVVAIDAGLGGGARDVAAVAREQRREVVALEASTSCALASLNGSSRTSGFARRCARRRRRSAGSAARRGCRRRDPRARQSPSDSARSTTLRSSRTLPGQSWRCSWSSSAGDCAKPPRPIFVGEARRRAPGCRPCARAAAARTSRRPRAGSRGPRGTGRPRPSRAGRGGSRRSRGCRRRPTASRRRGGPGGARARAAAAAAGRARARRSRRGTACRRSPPRSGPACRRRRR